MTTILLIHGINNQDNSKENIEKTWSDALRRGASAAGLAIPDDVKFIAAFYGDVLFKETESWNKNKPASRPRLTSATFGCDKITNIDQIDNGDEDAHDMLKYLGHSVVAKEIVLNL